MAKVPDWVRIYFGPKVSTLSPEVVAETTRFAVVKICDMNQKGGFNKTGYILVSKTGRYNITPHESLFEGVPDMGDLMKMKNSLDKSESA